MGLSSISEQLIEVVKQGADLAARGSEEATAVLPVLTDTLEPLVKSGIMTAAEVAGRTAASLILRMRARRRAGRYFCSQNWSATL